MEGLFGGAIEEIYVKGKGASTMLSEIEILKRQVKRLEHRVKEIERYLNQDDISPELREELARIAADKDY